MIIVLIVFLTLTMVSMLVYIAVSEFRDRCRKRKVETNLSLPDKTPIRLFAVEHKLHWRIDSTEYFDMGELREAKEDGRYLVGGYAEYGPHFEGIEIRRPEDLEEWRRKLKTLKDVKTWLEDQDMMYKEAKRVKEGNFE